jgi:cyanophycin synthetase
MIPGTFVQFSAFGGPSTLAPFAAAVADLELPPHPPLAPDRVRVLVDEYVPATLAELVTLPPQPLRLEALAAALARAVQDLAGPCELPVAIRERARGRSCILLGYHDVQTALHALRAGIEIANALFGRLGGGPDPRAAIATAVARASQVMTNRQPDPLARSLMRAARNRGLPVYAVAAGSRVWQFGQGSAGIHFFEAANQHDSPTGARLAGDKFLTNQLIRRLGLPGVEHELVRDLDGARQAAEQLGYPLAVKPLDAGKGRGVTAGVRSVAELEHAYARAARETRRGVLVERFVAGDDHRLSVFGGKLCFASHRAPPRIVGDGVRTVAQLIDAENASRSDADVAAGYLYRIEVDADLLNNLAAEELALGDTPANGRAITLRSIANVATGGRVRDCTETMHPDNRDLAETLARAFRMDALGIDFMTPDIAKSWREVPCAVLEINATPGFSSAERAERIVAAKFPNGADGRIPSVVVIGAERAALDDYADTLRDAGLRVGDTDGRLTRLDGRIRCTGAQTLPARVTALLLDPGCDALVIGTSVEEIERHGFPLDRCELAVVGAGIALPDALADLVRACARTTLFGTAGEPLPQLVPTAVAGLVDRSRAANVA